MELFIETLKGKTERYEVIRLLWTLWMISMLSMITLTSSLELAQNMPQYLNLFYALTGTAGVVELVTIVMMILCIRIVVLQKYKK